ncbi:IBR domain protein [Necator americanus]|uniref:RBR-type E3 ubiquitin transferase n=1 Tax=Necator americanus TaxID=51031 RepID=W2T5T1_NECAM|nr:IBR domain protein [Necator americanus]ETN77370.1 IBR domain protein [Necator americanus]
MWNQFPAEQTEEIEAVVSCFGEKFVSVDSSGEELRGVILVVLEPRSKPIVVCASDGKTHGQFETTQLSPVDLRFRLPAEYPAKKATVDVDCIWMPTSMKMQPMEMLEKVREECEKAELDEFEAHCHDCEVCFENKTGRECVRFSPCRHTFCKECVAAYFKEKLLQEISLLSCPSDSCVTNAPQKLIVELLGEEAFERYERLLLSRVLNGMSDMATCPRIACQKPAALSQIIDNLATCLVCGHSFCTKCFKAYHGVQKCRTKYNLSVFVENSDFTWGFQEVSLLEFLRATDEERTQMGYWYGGIEKLEAEMEALIKEKEWRSYAWIEENVPDRCPGCAIAIQKNEGCNHMYCTMCGTRFCWNCKVILNSHNINRHSNGNCERAAQS